MNPLVSIPIALVAISAIVSFVLAIAWREFGRPRHALTWSVAFGLGAVMWALDLIWLAAHPGDGAAGAPMLMVAGFVSTLNTLGFRQRAGIREGRSPLVAAGAVHAVLVLVLTTLGAGAAARAMPLSLLNAAMFALAARALVGRRQGERAAAHAVQAGLLLLSLLNLMFLVGIVASLGGVAAVDLAMLGRLTILLMPAIVTGIALFSIVLLTADLADQARRLAATDILTGLLNRRGFEEAARSLIQSARRNRRSIALVLIDVDRFKDINDRFGHPAGDRVLTALGATLGAGIGRRDVLARIGGEEFALIMADVDLAAAQCAAEVLRTSVAAMPAGLAQPLQVTASFGVTCLRPDDAGLAELLERADAALYRAKASGRDRVVTA